MFPSSAGHVADMISRLKNNGTLRKKKGYYAKMEPLVSKEKHIGFLFNPVPAEQKRRFLSSFLKEKEEQRVLGKIVLLVYAGLAISAFVWLINYIN